MKRVLDLGKRSLYSIPRSTEIISAVKKIDLLKTEIQTKYQAADDGLRLAIQDKLRALWTYHSNAIEGSRLSLGDTIFYLQEGLTVSGKPLKDFLDTKNHADAIDFLRSVIDEKYPITESFLAQINMILLDNTGEVPGVDALGKKILRKISPGKYKEMPNHVIQPDGSIHRYVEPFDVSHQMRDLCQWISDRSSECDIHPAEMAALAHYNFVRIHPFEDGNGRTARILMNLILLKAGYSPAVIKIEDRKEYLSCLKAADKSDPQPLILFVCHALFWTQEAVLEELNKYGAATSFSSKGLKP